MSERRVLQGNDMRPLKFHRDGYVLRPGGAAYARTFEFVVPHGKRGVRVDYRETLVRSARTGRLLRVERRAHKPPCP